MSQQNFRSVFVMSAIAVGIFSANSVIAQTPLTAGSAPPAQVLATAGDYTEGEIRKIDKDSKKITIKHGEIKNLDMPPMTMVFVVKDVAVLDTLQTGARIRFKAENIKGTLTVTEIQSVK